MTKVLEKSYTENQDPIDLGDATVETKGAPPGNSPDLIPQKFAQVGLTAD